MSVNYNYTRNTSCFRLQHTSTQQILEFLVIESDPPHWHTARSQIINIQVVNLNSSCLVELKGLDGYPESVMLKEWMIFSHANGRAVWNQLRERGWQEVSKVK